MRLSKRPQMGCSGNTAVTEIGAGLYERAFASAQVKPEDSPAAGGAQLGPAGYDRAGDGQSGRDCL